MNVSERHGVDTRTLRRVDCRAEHAFLNVFGIAREYDLVNREPQSLRLSADEIASHGVERHPPRVVVECRQQSDDLDVCGVEKV